MLLIKSTQLDDFKNKKAFLGLFYYALICTEQGPEGKYMDGIWLISNLCISLGKNP